MIRNILKQKDCRIGNITTEIKVKRNHLIVMFLTELDFVNVIKIFECVTTVSYFGAGVYKLEKFL